MSHSWLTWLPDVHVEGAEPPPNGRAEADAQRKLVSSTYAAKEEP
jgi:hypothetical protein